MWNRLITRWDESSFERRVVLLGGLLGGISLALPTGKAAGTEPQTLPPWSPGTLDIHHIDTGVGNATFVLGPDGTTLLIDCGATRGGPPASTPLRPDGARSAGEAVARYALRHARAAGRTSLDYMIATHVHPDHVGSPLMGDRRASEGYILTGLSEVDALMPAQTVIDRGFPDYASLPLTSAPFAVNHLAWLKARVKAGRRVEKVAVGSARQVTSRRAGAFTLRFVGGDGRVWTGAEGRSRDLLAPKSSWTPEATPEENHMSIAMVLAYGGFRYFAGGDLVADTHDGTVPWLDVETPIVEAAGRVDVASADHHGYFDACRPGFTRALDADTYVIQAWHATHPAMSSLQRLSNAWRGRSPRDVFITRLDPASRAINARFLPQVKSTEGNVVVRVHADGRYRIYVTDSRDERDSITSVSRERLAKLPRIA
ncbi:MBL fold metallo-hydrolase [Sphingomonas sp. H39-1-10]|uniref:ComEC/Rec2 family competence protein n=1 Tax=Sphingomonas TaxID=13687 RepID=UPI0008903FCF|nr:MULTISPECIES: MBL fold metallo-hydrolase [Sphingomonas]MDF0486719.1 MBL fold metallo-hydrolase [Sphingomonas pollutisoli]SDA35432.1 Metal-dependent hydrolase, beta-lactamase superfamily II [Sphingomonas sp. NFR15]